MVEAKLSGTDSPARSTNKFILCIDFFGWASSPPIPKFQKVKLWNDKINQRHPKESRVEIPVLELIPLAFVHNSLTCEPSIIASVKSAPVISTPSKVERSKIVSAKIAPLKSALVKLVKSILALENSAERSI